MGVLAELAEQHFDKTMPEALDEAGRRSVAILKEELATAYPPASSPGEFPHKRTGHLQQEIHAMTILNDGVCRISTEAPYSVYLEFGTSKMAARPFMTPTMMKGEHLVPALHKL